MIRIDALWLATVPIDMRMGTERLLAQVVQVFGAAQAHHGYTIKMPCLAAYDSCGSGICEIADVSFSSCCCSKLMGDIWPKPE
jgi:hypothetical protein